jgi:hypothetical protein
LGTSGDGQARSPRAVWRKSSGTTHPWRSSPRPPRRPPWLPAGRARAGRGSGRAGETHPAGPTNARPSLGQLRPAACCATRACGIAYYARGARSFARAAARRRQRTAGVAVGCGRRADGVCIPAAAQLRRR